jgi:uncharacterized protein (DUF4213/DUF364 family)
MWRLYDELIGGIPPEARVDEAFQGPYWTLVRSGAGVGLAMTLSEATRPAILPQSPVSTPEGMPLAELAGAVKSWNFTEASMGMAAVNAYWNSPEREAVKKALKNGDTEAFSAWRERAAGKKVAVIGHFFQIEKTLGPVCDLSIIEMRPSPGDYPDSACEYLLPDQDFVFATGVTLINKTLPRLLELSRACGIILAGPSVPLAPRLFELGARDLEGFVVTDPERCSAIVRETSARPQESCPRAPFFRSGTRVSLTP